MALILWVFGGVITFCGLSVFLEFGLAIPRSGGEKVYLERVYRWPRGMTSFAMAAQLILLVWPASNALAFGRYVLLANGIAQDGWPARGVGVALVVAINVLCAITPKWSIYVSNILGIIKTLVLLLIVGAGLAALAGHRQAPNPQNFKNVFAVEDASGYSVYGISSAMLGVIFSFRGWENANYIAGELKDPRKTLALATPLAVGGVTILYTLVNIAFFAVVPRSDLIKAEVLVSGLFFEKMFGEFGVARVLPVFIAISNAGAALAFSYTHARVIQNLGKENLLPYSMFWTSDRPFGSPTAALLLQSFMTIVVLIAPPPGPAYSFIISLTAYPTTWIHAFVTGGLIWLRFRKSENWSSPWRSPVIILVLYLFTNIFLLLAPFIPNPQNNRKGAYPYFTVPLVGTLTLFLCILYWFIRMRLLPQWRGYVIVGEHRTDSNQCTYIVYKKMKFSKQH
ncbi:hypothetical protein VHEMI05482 [[Torrubiella] hemipterigena]|nr:hypothetical protein VHEMI05482 [[Torrubiella] hemipterigena]